MSQPRLGQALSLYPLLAVGLVAAIVPFVHVLGDLYNVWNLKPEYSHGFIIPVISLFLIWRQREELRSLPFTGSWLAMILIAAGLGLRLVGDLTTMHTLEHYAFLLVLYGLVLALTGPTIFRRMWVPLLMLAFALPLPSFFDNALSLRLQLLSSQLGVWVIRTAGISVLLEGNIIDLGNFQLEVAQACSGLRYLFPLMTLALIVAYLFRGAMWKRVVIFLSSIPITVLMNGLRIGFIGMTVERWGPTMAEGTLHDFEGWLVFMLSSGLLLLTTAGLGALGGKRTSLGEMLSLHLPPLQQPTDPRVAPGKPAIPASFIAAVVFVLAGAALEDLVPTQSPTLPVRTDFAGFPTQIAQWEGRRDTLAPVYLDALSLDDYALINYQTPGASPVNFYAAYYRTQDSNRHVHSPRDCIPGGGWQIQKLEERTFPSRDGASAFHVNRAIVQLGPNRQIVYFWYQERGRHLTGDYQSRWYLFWDGLTRRRTDGALVRFVSPIPAGGDEAKVDATLLELAGKIVPTLEQYIPN